MKKLIITLLLALPLGLHAQDWKNLTYDVQIGYGIGGSMPVPLPKEIRSLHEYRLQGNWMIASNAYLPMGGPWGLAGGIKLENKGMKSFAGVKNYHMEMTQGGESLEGRYTGNVMTHVRAWMVTVPVRLTYNLGKDVRLMFGPYLSYIMDRSFDGYAYDGYLRVGSPVGPKVQIGNDDNTRGTYDFSSHMRRLQAGLDLSADWYFSKRWGIFGDLSYGVTGVHHSDFKTIEMTLHPVYFTLGVTHKLK